VRRFVAGLALMLAALVGSVALTSFVLSTTVLDPDRPGRVIEALMDDPGRRDQLADELLGTASSNPSLRRELDTLLDDPDVRREVRELRSRGDGSLDSRALSEQVARELDERGKARAASVLRRADPRMALPELYADRFTQLGDAASFAAVAGAATCAGLVLLAMSISPDPRRTATAAGFAVLLAVGGTVLLFHGIPRLLDLVSDSGWLPVAADSVRAATGDTVAPLIVVGGVGVVLVLAGLLWPRPRRG
jgi:hypothetical protein